VILEKESLALRDCRHYPSCSNKVNDQIIRALYHSIETGSFVRLDTLECQQRPTAEQAIERPPVQEQPDLVHAAAPSGKS